MYKKIPLNVINTPHKSRKTMEISTATPTGLVTVREISRPNIESIYTVILTEQNKVQLVMFKSHNSTKLFYYYKNHVKLTKVY